MTGIGFGGPPDARNWTIDGTSGAGWGMGTNAGGQWPLEVVQGDWAAKHVQALGMTRPAAIVIELGTNDALRADFAAAASNTTALANRQSGTDNNIKGDVALARTMTSCIVLVTPSTFPTTLYGPGTIQTEEVFAQQAARVDAELKQQELVSSEGSTLIADWATISATHHLPSGASGNWFSSDEVHPNFAGEQQLASLIDRTVNTCPSPVRTTGSSLEAQPS